MIIDVTRLRIRCDYPGCEQRFVGREGEPAALMRRRAGTVRWIVTSENPARDFCGEHADLHLNRPPQQPLFPIPGVDDPV